MPSVVYWLLAAIWVYLAATYVAVRYVDSHFAEVVYDRKSALVELLKKLDRISIWDGLSKSSSWWSVWLSWALLFAVVAGPVALLILVPVARILPILIILAVAVVIVPLEANHYFAESLRGPNPDVPDYAVTLREREAHSGRMGRSCLWVLAAILVGVFCVLALVFGWYRSWPVALAVAAVVGIALFAWMRSE